MHVPGWGSPARAHQRLLTDQRSYSYAIEDGPLPVKNNQGKFAVQPAGDDSAIVWKAEFEAIDPSQEQAMSEMWDGAMDQVLGAVKERIETA